MGPLGNLAWSFLWWMGWSSAAEHLVRTPSHPPVLHPCLLLSRFTTKSVINLNNIHRKTFSGCYFCWPAGSTDPLDFYNLEDPFHKLIEFPFSTEENWLKLFICSQSCETNTAITQSLKKKTKMMSAKSSFSVWMVARSSQQDMEWKCVEIFFELLNSCLSPLSQGSSCARPSSTCAGGSAWKVTCTIRLTWGGNRK